jgi:hypothetical protein
VSRSEYVEKFTEPVAALELVAATAAGTTATNAALSHTRDGLKCLTHDAAASVYGLAPKATTALAATGFLKTQDEPQLDVEIKTPAAADWSLAQLLVGLVPAELDDAGGSVVGDLPGQYANADLTVGAWFWFAESAADNKLQLGYRSTIDELANLVLDGFVVSPEQRIALQVRLDAERKPHFSAAFGAEPLVEVHVGDTALDDDTALVPRVYLIGDARSLYFRRLTVSRKDP